MENEDHKKGAEESPEDTLRAEITEIGKSEYNIDVTHRHGLGTEGGDIADLLPSPSAVATTAAGLASGQVWKAMEQVLESTGGTLPVGGKILLHLNGLGPAAVLDVAISAESEGVTQAVVSTTAGVVVQIVVTAGVGGTPLAPLAPLLGAIAGSLANSGVDLVFETYFEPERSIKDDSLIQNNNNHVSLPQPSPNPPAINYNQSTGELSSTLPDSTNLILIKGLQEAGHNIRSLESSAGSYEVGSPADLEMLSHPDGSVAVVIDPDGQWEMIRNIDGNGTVRYTTDAGQEPINFSAGEPLTLNSINGEDAFHLEIDSLGKLTTRSASLEEVFGDNPPGTTGVEVTVHSTGVQGTENTNVGDTPLGSSSTYTIQPGDTLSEIAAANNTTVAVLSRANPSISDPNTIYAGREVQIPIEGSANLKLSDSGGYFSSLNVSESLDQFSFFDNDILSAKLQQIRNEPEYTLTFNVMHDTLTGHSNVTLTSPDGSRSTFGRQLDVTDLDIVDYLGIADLHDSAKDGKIESSENRRLTVAQENEQLRGEELLVSQSITVTAEQYNLISTYLNGISAADRPKSDYDITGANPAMGSDRTNILVY